MLEVLSFCDRERAYPPLTKITMILFLGNQKYMKLSGVSGFWESAKKVSVKSDSQSFLSSNQRSVQSWSLEQATATSMRQETFWKIICAFISLRVGQS